MRSRDLGKPKTSACVAAVYQAVGDQFEVGEDSMQDQQTPYKIRKNSNIRFSAIAPRREVDDLLEVIRLELAWLRIRKKKNTVERDLAHQTYDLHVFKDNGRVALKLRSQLPDLEKKLSGLEQRLRNLEDHLRDSKYRLRVEVLQHYHRLADRYGNPLSRVSHLIEFRYGGICSACNIHVPAIAWTAVKARVVVICEKCSLFVLCEGDFRSL